MNRNIKIAAKAVLLYTPDFINAKIQKFSAKSRMKRALEIAHRTQVTLDDVSHVLDQFSFDTDVMLHSSLTNIGKIKGGTRGVTNIILDKINVSKHTLLVSALPYHGSFASWLTDDTVFDVRTAPIAMGAINERIALMDGAMRSIHPTHSVVAIGPSAQEYVNEHHLGQTPFSVYSPYYKLITHHAKILLFGTKLNNMTFVHAIEDLIGDVHPVRVYEKKMYNIKCIDSQGNELFVHTPVHSRFQSLFRDGMRVHDLLIEKGVMKSIPFGESEVSIVDCFDYAMVYLDCIANGKSIYGSHKVTRPLLNRIEEIKRQLIQI